jgi:hypothetical protein
MSNNLNFCNTDEVYLTFKIKFTEVTNYNKIKKFPAQQFDVEKKL